MARPSIIFVCTANCCRSQMAEGLMREMAGQRFDVCSAGSHPAGYVHPLVVAVMSEIGIDVGDQWSKGVDEFAGRTFDYVVTVCDDAHRACPALSGRRGTFHWPVADPVSVLGDDAAVVAAARRTRDELKKRLAGLMDEVRNLDEEAS